MSQALFDKIESEQFRKDSANFHVGDSVRVHTKVIEGDKYLFNKLFVDFKDFHDVSARYAKTNTILSLMPAKTLVPPLLKKPVVIDGKVQSAGLS